jgi:hypothetical protein
MILFPDAAGFQQGIISQRFAGLFDIGEIRKILGRKNFDVGAFENIGYFREFIVIVGGDYQPG